MDEAPKHAERLSLFEYWTLARRPSRFVMGAQAMVPEMSCPSCKVLVDPVPHDMTNAECPHCRLHMRIEGLQLLIWRPEPVKASAHG